MSPSEDTVPAASNSGAPAPFLRDALVFHAKLLLYGVCDLLLFPVTLIAALLDLILRSDPPGRLFYRAVGLGRTADVWIDLFAAAARSPGAGQHEETRVPPNVDALVDEFESKLRDAYGRSDASGATRRAIDRILRATRKATDD